jgi:thiol-disulfide isomerase/thioredoxin
MTRILVATLAAACLAVGCAAPPEEVSERPAAQETPQSTAPANATRGQAAQQPAPPPPAEKAPASPAAKEAPAISATYWLNSEALTLDALRGRIVVVEFWATWCPPCRTSIPHLIELHKKYGPKGVTIVSLTNEPKETVEPFAKELGMTYAIGGGSTSAAAYGVRGIPTAFIVDTAGAIAWQGHPMDPKFVTALDEQLAKTPPKVEPPTKE